MAYIQGENRDQLTLMPMCLDDCIGADNICRVIAAYVNSLDMATLGFKYAKTKDTGRPPHDPANMLMLYIYGYLNRIRSSRRLEAETKRNVEVMWLMEKVTPDDKTISNFRKDNAAALRKVFWEFSLWCNRQGLYGKELVAVDSTKIRANNSRKNIHTQTGTEKELATVEKKISEYMKLLDENDIIEKNEVKLSAEAIRETLKRLGEKKETLSSWLNRIEENGGNEISTVDSDAHIMHQHGDGRSFDACYNIQAVVDGKNKLIVDFEVTTCASEQGALHKMTESAKEIMGVEKIAVTADKGYYDGKDILDCEEKGTTCYIPKITMPSHAPDKCYDKRYFKYDKENDCYICPSGARLDFAYLSRRSCQEGKMGYGIVERVYRNAEACRICANRGKCTTNKRGVRTIYRIPNQDILDIVNSRMLTDIGRQYLVERRKIVEHPFGTTKKGWGFRDFQCRGIERVTGEQSLVFLAYNFRRAVNILKENGKSMIMALA